MVNTCTVLTPTADETIASAAVPLILLLEAATALAEATGASLGLLPARIPWLGTGGARGGGARVGGARGGGARGGGARVGRARVGGGGGDTLRSDKGITGGVFSSPGSS